MLPHNIGLFWAVAGDRMPLCSDFSSLVTPLWPIKLASLTILPRVDGLFWRNAMLWDVIVHEECRYGS